MRMGIPEESLIPGAIYIVDAKDFSVAIWNGRAFQGPRFAHSVWSFSEELPWEAGPPFGSAIAKERIGDSVLTPPYDGHNVLQVLISFNAYYESFQANQKVD